MTVHKHAKGIGQWVAGFIAVLVVGLLGSTAFGSLAHATGTGGGGNPVTTAVDCGPTDRYNRGLNEAMQAVQRKAKNQYPDTFGQLSVKTGNPEDGIFLSFSEDAGDKVAELAEDFACPDLLIAVSINYSAKEVVGFQDRVTVDRRKATRGLAPLGHATNGEWWTGGYIDEAVVDIGIPLVTKRIRAAFRSEYSAKDVRVKITRKPIPFPYPFFNDGYKGMTILLVETGYYGDDVETGQDWEVRLKKLNRNLRQTKKRFKLAKAKGSHQQARKLKRRIIKKRLRKQRLRRKMLGLPWPIQRAS